MENVIRIAKHLIPIEQIALVEPFIAPTDPPLRTEKEFKARIVRIDRISVLSEQTPEEFAKENGFRLIVAERVATNPALAFRVERFEPTEDFQPARPFQSRLLWNSADGSTNSKLLLSSPEKVLAIAVRGEPDPDFDAVSEDHVSERPPRGRSRRRPRLVNSEPTER